MTSEYQEISTNKLLDAAKQLIITDELHLAEFYLNLIKYSNNSDSIGAKIQSIYNLSSIYKLLHNEPQLLHIGRKIIKLITLLDLKRYNHEVLLMITQILLNCAEECQSKYTSMLTGWFLFISKNISMEHSIKDANINDKIRTMFPKFLKHLNESLYETYQEDLKTKKQNLINLSQSVKVYLSQTIKYNIGDTVYIIDSNWLNNMIQFINEFNECKDKNEKLFTANNVCLLYYDKSPDVSDMKGHFCGPINNFLLTRPKCYWEDPIEQYTNVYVSKGVCEGKDYYVVNKELYTKINFYFKCTNEIERKCVTLRESEGVGPEVHLFNINVLYLNEYIRSKNKEDIIPKAIQISYHATLSDVIKKVERCFIHYAKQKKYEDYEYEFKMYLIPFNKKEIIEMILWYVNLNKTFKFKGDDLLSMNSSLTVDTIFNTSSSNSSNTSKYIIICEPISKNSIVKPFLKKLTDTLNCSCCNFIIPTNTINTTINNNIIRCSHCSQAIYCSDKCKSQDHHHIDFHKKINSLYEASLNVEEIQQININAFLDGKSRHGLVGLKNSGGIDFLLSPLQVLSHCKELTKFFLTGNFKSSKAKEDTPLCSAYAELINQLWVGSSPVVSPTNFRNVFFILIKELANASGIDACDIFVVILDKLHSELNEIKKRPDDLYFYEQDYGESDMQACNRWWKAHNLMNKSVIIDLFQGQIKRKIVCSVCKSVSVAYPPFLYIDLPIPDKEEMSKIHFRVFPYDYSYQYVSVEMYDINKFTTVKDIKKRIKEYKVFSSSTSTTVIEALLYKDCELVQILPDDVLIYDYIFTRYNFSDEEFIEYEISFIEKPKHEAKSDMVDFYVTPITFENVKGYFYTSTNIVPLSYTKVFSIKHKLTIRELYKEIFKYYRRAMDDMVKADDSGNIDDSYYTSFYQKLNDDTFIDNEYDKFTASTVTASNAVGVHGVFDLYFYHNFEHSNSWFFNGPKCEFCGNTAKTKFCKLNLPQSTQLKELTLMLKSSRPLFILVDFTKYKECFPQFYSRLADMSDPRLSFVEDVNIYDCFDIYQKEEKLKKEKEYECVKCRRKAEPLQQIELYRASKYLILNIKRFKKKFDDLMDMINNKKNETLVEFPLENLDLTSYFYGENEECVYDLIAIICHVGTIKSGHYFSIVKNEDNWYKIDDTEIVQLEKKGEVINKDALVLVYYKRDIKTTSSTKKKIKEDDDVLKINTSINAVSDVDFGEMKGL